MNQRQLPVHLNPGLSTECYHNYRLSILLAFPGGESWAHSHFVNLTVRGQGDGYFPMVRFEEHLDIYDGMLEEQTVECGAGWLDAVRQAVDEEAYMLVYVNWRHIPGSRYHGVRDMVHEALVYGYDDERQCLNVIGFDMHGKMYSPFQLDYTLFEAELERVLQHELHQQRWFAYYGFPLVRIRRLLPWRDAFNAQAVFFALDRGSIRSEQASESAYAAGCYVNEYLGGYFLRMHQEGPIGQGEFGLWNILMHKMAQHKRLMLQRIDYMRQQGGTREQELLRIRDFYTKSNACLSKARSMSLQYQRSCDRELMPLISEMFRKMFELEKRAVPMLKEYLVRQRLEAFG
ncbi:hypothetical protein DNH61_06360 [Paenibacillus sambharensis]|uniref:DUF4872 domain-containing protein n=1 Tax=Paenibacillus sambharensis TaxID=1803190 RepID=A0A2W1LZ79_9BACL|nr:hypothetical protein [Paenibacillus sambharensis]PZD96817.1 hypothetical protein DNH61_06360 [Paenibacillus sambharensis]